MNKITLFITLALITSSAQPVTREKLEKARNVTGIVSAVGMPAAQIIGSNVLIKDLREIRAAFDAGNVERLADLQTVGAKPGLVALAPVSCLIAHNIISAAFEKDVMLAVRLVDYLTKILAAKTPPPADLPERVNRLANLQMNIFNARQGMREIRDFLEISANHLEKEQDVFRKNSPEETKAMLIEATASIIHEILRYQLYKNVEKQFPGPDVRLTRRALRATIHSLIIGLLELAKQQAAQKWSPDAAHIYTPIKTTLLALLRMSLNETCGEMLYTQIEDITQKPETKPEENSQKRSRKRH